MHQRINQKIKVTAIFSLDEWKEWVHVGIGEESNNDELPSVDDDDNESGDDDCVVIVSSV